MHVYIWMYVWHVCVYLSLGVFLSVCVYAFLLLAPFCKEKDDASPYTFLLLYPTLQKKKMFYLILFIAN